MTQIDKAVDEEIVRKYGKIRTDVTPILYAILAELVEARLLCATKQQKSEPEPMQPELNLEQPKKSPQAKKKK